MVVLGGHHSTRSGRTSLLAPEMTTTELRVEVDSSEVAVLDGYCAATGKHRSEVIRFLLREWSAAKHYEATVILRVAGSNPTDPETARNRA